MTSSLCLPLSPSLINFRQLIQAAGRSVLARICIMLLPVLGLTFPVYTEGSAAVPDPELRQLLRSTVNESESFPDRFDAEVWLVDMSARMRRYIKDPQTRLELLKLVHLEATKADLSPELVLSVIHVESLFDRFAISRVGAQGLMQIMPFWKNEIGRPDDNLMNTSTNLRYGCTILKYYLKREKGNLIRALARYNGSLGKTWYPEKVMNAWEKYWFVKHH